LVTDKYTNWTADGIDDVVAEGQNDFSIRIKYAIDYIPPICAGHLG
jgi:hypothetical protein